MNLAIDEWMLRSQINLSILEQDLLDVSPVYS